MGIIVGLRISEEGSKLSIQTALDVFSVFSKNARLLRKFAFFFIGIDMLFKSPHWRYPRWLANECCDLACDGVDLWRIWMPDDLLGVRFCLTIRDTCSPISDMPNVLPSEVYVVIPICGMK